MNSLSDVITMGYSINGFPTTDDDDFGTADLSGYVDNTSFADALKYSMGGSFKTPDFFGKKCPVIENKEPVKKSCTCGAHKTYGTKCGLSAHSSWCDLKL
jgi:hypothetical protein